MGSGVYRHGIIGFFPEDGQLKHASSCPGGSTPIPANADSKHKFHKNTLSSEIGHSPNEDDKFRYDRRLFSHDSTAFITLLRSCARKKDLSQGTRVHEEIQKRGLLNECSDDLVVMYAKCGELSKAQEMLYGYRCKSVFPWNALIAAYARKDQGHDALNVFTEMQFEGLSPSAVTFTGIFKACGSMQAVDKGQEFHDEIVRQGLLAKDAVLGNALVDMYAKCGALLKAHRVLKELPYRDVVTWNSLIAGCAQHGQGEQALRCLGDMQKDGLSPNGVTFTCILKVCGMLQESEKGEWIHEQISRQGLLRDNIILGTALVDMYAKCGALAKAKEVLEQLSIRDIVAWNALIVGYTQQGQGEQALECYVKMQKEGLSPDAVTFSCILKACGGLGALVKGEQLHREISRRGFLENNVVVGNALVGMYIKCNALEKAQQVLEELPLQDVVTWNTFMTGLVQDGRGEQALNSFDIMCSRGLVPTPVTFACILKACGLLGAVDRGKHFHDEISRQGLITDNIMLGTALVDMYAKCGALANAAQLLQELPFRDTVTWNALIAGYAQQGLCEQILECFTQMHNEHCLPDAVTFASVLNACSHLGLVEDGFMYFKDMSIKYGIKQGIEHYTCMIDLLGRSGHIDKAVKMIQELPLADDSAAWSTLVDACGKWGDVTVGRWAFEQAVLANESDEGAYVLIANAQMAIGLQVDADILYGVGT